MTWQTAWANPKVQAALHSAWITALACVAGIYVDALANGATGSPEQLLGYYKAHAWAWAVANVITPAVRAYQAKPSGGTSGN